MMPILRIDLFLLTKLFQPLANHLERITGMNCFRLAAHALLCGIGLFIVRQIYVGYLWSLGQWPLLGPVSAVLLGPVFVFAWKPIHDRAIRMARAVEAGKIVIPTLIVYQSFARVFWLLFILTDLMLIAADIDAMDFSGLIQDTSLWIGMYFINCLPKPPHRVLATQFATPSLHS